MTILKTPDEMRLMEQAGAKLGGVFDYIRPFIKPGVSTLALDQLCEKYLRKQGCTPSFKGFEGFPGTICASVNAGIIHQIPKADTVLKEGDLLKIDIGNIAASGYQGDAARAYTVGQPSPLAEKLIEATQEAFWAALKVVRPGARTGDIGCAIQQVAAKYGFYCLEEFGGHGIGTSMHEDPFIPNFGKELGRGAIIRAGMCICIEPMLIANTSAISLEDDGWGVVSKDGSLSCHYENTICVYNDRNVITTVDSQVQAHLEKEGLS